jgi:hypothetical protein
MKASMQRACSSRMMLSGRLNCAVSGECVHCLRPVMKASMQRACGSRMVLSGSLLWTVQ